MSTQANHRRSEHEHGVHDYADITQGSTMKRRFSIHTVLFLALAGCAGMNRSCSNGCADQFGADWVVVQMDNDGRPYRCWELRSTSVASESGDGVYWKDDKSGNLVHISGHFNRVQVTGGNWGHAYATLGLTAATCQEVRDQAYDPVSRTFAVKAEK